MTNRRCRSLGRRRSHQDVLVGTKPASRVEALLYELCVRYGYCLPSDKRDAIVAKPPSDAETFVDAVLRAEGLEPDSVDKQARKVLVAMVERWLFDGGSSTGSQSGLT